MKKLMSTGFKWLWIAVVVVLIDRYSKMWVVDHLTFGEPLTILPFFNFTLAYNTGAAFSFLHAESGWQNIFLGSIAVIISILILAWLYQMPSRERWFNIAACLVLGGALGNLWDRFLYSYVIDFLDFHLSGYHFAIFNVADSAITVGAFMLFWYWMREAK